MQVTVQKVALKRKNLGTPRMEPGSARWEASMQPLCYAASLAKLTLQVVKTTNKWPQNLARGQQAITRFGASNGIILPPPIEATGDN